VRGSASLPYLGFGWKRRRIHFSDEAPEGARRAYPPFASPPSSFHREERARCLEPKHCNRRIETYAHDVARCTRFGRAGPARRIRRAPWRWSIHPLVEWTAPGDACLRPLRRGRTHDGWLFERCQPLASPSKSLPVWRSIHSTAGSSPHLFTKRDSWRERRKPSIHPFSLLDREGASRHLSQYFPKTSLPLEQRPRRCSIRFCHRHYMRARSRCPSSSLDPKCSLAGTTANLRLRAARGGPVRGHPLPA